VGYHTDQTSLSSQNSNLHALILDQIQWSIHRTLWTFWQWYELMFYLLNLLPCASCVKTCQLIWNYAYPQKHMVRSQTHWLRCLHWQQWNKWIHQLETDVEPTAEDAWTATESTTTLYQFNDPLTGLLKTHYAPWFCSFRLWRFINHLLTYLTFLPVESTLSKYCRS